MVPSYQLNIDKLTAWDDFPSELYVLSEKQADDVNIFICNCSGRILMSMESIRITYQQEEMIDRQGEEGQLPLMYEPRWESLGCMETQSEVLPRKRRA